MTDKNILPCPFCGGKPEFRRSGRSGHYIACSSCDSASTMFTAAKDDVKELLIETWNRRHSRPAPSQQQKFDDIVEKSLRIWFFNYDTMDEAKKEIYRVTMREVVSFVAVNNIDNAVKALHEISSLGFVAAKDAPDAHDEVVKIARSVLSPEPKIIKSIENGYADYCKFVDLEEVGFMSKTGDSLDINFDDDLSWQDGEKIYRIKRK